MYFLGSSGSNLPVCASCQYTFSASGNSTAAITGNTFNVQLSPNVAIIASELSVHVDTPPGIGRTRLFFLTIKGDAGGLRCAITGADDTCSSGAQTYPMPANSQILIEAANINEAPTTLFQFSWRATVK
jgi:hypothetical protein